MAYTYRISMVIGKLDNSACPPPFIKSIFPNYEGQTITVTEQDCVVTFDSPQTPADLGPLVKVELLPSE